MKNASGTGGRRVVALRGALAACFIGISMLVLVTCETTDPVAPEGSTIRVTANPQTILVLNNVPGRSTITATLRSKSGTRLMDQEVTFSTTEGTLDPPAETSLTTNDQGQATSILETTKQATVRALSGTISGETTVSIVTGNIGSIILDADTQDIAACDETVFLWVSVEDPSGNPVAGIAIKFRTQVPSGYTELRGSFNPTQARTDASGEAESEFNPDDNYCTQKCSPSLGDPNSTTGWNCAIEIIAEDVSGAFSSAPVTINENVP